MFELAGNAIGIPGEKCPAEFAPNHDEGITDKIYATADTLKK
jgi:hypothetical protein